jgi:hypothetical protein
MPMVLAPMVYRGPNVRLKVAHTWAMELTASALNAPHLFLEAHAATLTVPALTI